MGNHGDWMVWLLELPARPKRARWHIGVTAPRRHMLRARAKMRRKTSRKLRRRARARLR